MQLDVSVKHVGAAFSAAMMLPSSDWGSPLCTSCSGDIFQSPPTTQCAWPRLATNAPRAMSKPLFAAPRPSEQWP
eukprot:1626044-Alexandrium_andersonii.AAC.1